MVSVGSLKQMTNKSKIEDELVNQLTFILYKLEIVSFQGDFLIGLLSFELFHSGNSLLDKNFFYWNAPEKIINKNST